MVHTGLDVDYQQCADQAVLKGLHRITQHHPRLKTTKPQAALLSISLIDNGIRAWVGGRDYSASQFCRISQAMRQPGSAFKPIVYLTALDASLNNYRTARTTSLLADEPLTLEVRGTGLWSPQNYSKKYYGEVTVRQALLKSLNIPTVNLALKVGIPSVKRTAQALGLESPMLAVPSLALGAAETRLLDLTQAYQTFASGCHFHRLRAVSAITSPDDAEPLYMSPNDSRKVCSEDAAYVLTNMLQSVIEHGTGRVVRRLGFERPAAGKTGTSNDARDSWFAGYTPSLLTVVWVGFDDSRNLGLTGSQAAAPIWTDYMKCTEEFEPALNFLPPDGVVFKHIDAPSGLLWTPSCSESDKITEVFVKGTEPITPCHRPPGYESQDRRQQGRTPSPTPRSRKMSLFNRIFGS
jgi:membrane carboxypeptidase/penicillin-binding protein